MKVLPHLNTPAEDASLWIVRLQKGLAPDERERFEAWRAEPANARAFERIQADWSLLNLPRQKGQAGALLALLDRRRRTRRRRLRVFGGVGLAAAASLALFLTLPSPKPDAANVAKAPSIALKPDRKFLPDGSVVELNAGADIAVDFSGANRRVKLLRGEALFAVAKDPARPFVVSAGPVDVTAVGTAFTVKHAGDSIRVLVTEGRVAVSQLLPDAPPTAPVFVAAGEHLTVAASLTAPQRADPAVVAQELAWRGQRVEFTDTPLAEAVALFNRRNRLQLEISDPALAGIRLNGIYWADDPEGFVRLLEDGMGVKASPNGRGLVLGRR